MKPDLETFIHLKHIPAGFFFLPVFRDARMSDDKAMTTFNE